MASLGKKNQSETVPDHSDALRLLAEMRLQTVEEEILPIRVILKL